MYYAPIDYRFPQSLSIFINDINELANAIATRFASGMALPPIPREGGG